MTFMSSLSTDIWLPALLLEWKAMAYLIRNVADLWRLVFREGELLDQKYTMNYDYFKCWCRLYVFINIKPGKVKPNNYYPRRWGVSTTDLLGQNPHSHASTIQNKLPLETVVISHFSGMNVECGILVEYLCIIFLKHLILGQIPLIQPIPSIISQEPKYWQNNCVNPYLWFRSCNNPCRLMN